VSAEVVDPISDEFGGRWASAVVAVVQVRFGGHVHGPFSLEDTSPVPAPPLPIRPARSSPERLLIQPVSVPPGANGPGRAVIMVCGIGSVVKGHRVHVLLQFHTHCSRHRIAAGLPRAPHAPASVFLCARSDGYPVIQARSKMGECELRGFRVE